MSFDGSTRCLAPASCTNTVAFGQSRRSDPAAPAQEPASGNGGSVNPAGGNAGYSYYFENTVLSEQTLINQYEVHHEYGWWIFTEDDTLPGKPVEALHGPLAREVLRRAAAEPF